MTRWHYRFLYLAALVVLVLGATSAAGGHAWVAWAQAGIASFCTWAAGLLHERYYRELARRDRFELYRRASVIEPWRDE